MPTGIGTILANYDRWEQRLRDRLETALTEIMLDLEAQAKSDHPYTDQTGFNSASIRGFVHSVTRDEMVGVLSASMVYSRFLELMQNGQYAYLWPTVQKNKADIKTILEAVAK